MTLFTVLPIMISMGLVFLFRFLNKKYNPPIFGVYQRRNKYFWFKFMLMYFFLRVKQLYNHLRRIMAVELGSSSDGTVHIHEHDQALEKKYYLGDYPSAVDAVYFNGMSNKGAAVICGIARRQQHYCDAFLYLKVEGQELLLHPSLPDTHLKQNPAEEREYSAEGMSIVNFIPMRTWKLSYKGELKPGNSPDDRVKVDMDLTWSANWPIFNYDNHMAPLSLANDMARESWSADYFNLLKKLHQTHYEQMGFIEGSVFIDGKEHRLNMPCVRDHSFGKFREWHAFHRYVYHFIYLENGDCMAVGSVSQPAIMSHLTIGYLCRKSDNQNVFPVKSCDFQMWQHGENQILPKDYGFMFEAGGGTYDVQVQVNEEDTFYIGKMRESKFYERWSTVKVNGVNGWACVEWQYNNVPAAINKKL